MVDTEMCYSDSTFKEGFAVRSATSLRGLGNTFMGHFEILPTVFTSLLGLPH